MKLFPKFFFDTQAEGANGGGGDSTEVAEPIINSDTKGEGQQTTEEQSAPPVEKVEPFITEEEMKGYGFDSKEAFKEFLTKQKEANIPDADKKAKEDIEEANFLKFSTENKFLNVDEYAQYKNQKTIADIELVRQNKFNEFKEENPEITDEEELKDAFDEDFNFEYKLKSENESVKKRAEAKIAKEAKELRSPNESKVTIAQSQFNEEKKIREAYPKFEKFVQDSITKNTPDKTVLYKAKNGEDEIAIEIELTAKDREAMAKDFKTPKTFQLFANGKPEEVQSALDKKMQSWVKLNKFEEVNTKSFEAGKGIGTKSGSDTGADHPFAMKQGAMANVANAETLEESNAKIAEARRIFNQGRN